MTQSALWEVPRRKRDFCRFRRRRPRGRGTEGQAAGRWPTEQNLGRQVEKALQNRAFRPTMRAKPAHRQLGICPCDDAKAEAKQWVCALWIAEACQKLASSRSTANDRAFWLRRCQRNVGTCRRCEALLGPIFRGSRGLTYARRATSLRSPPESRTLQGFLLTLRTSCKPARHMSHALDARATREGAIGKIALRAYWGVSRASSRLSTRRRSRKKAKPPARHSPGAEEGEFLFWLRSSRCRSKPQSGARSHRTAELGTGVQLGAGFFRPPGKRCTAQRGARR